ncbi:non-ribosomal peptide synthetase [Bailinhaonella thermotolerans]|uniref:non-ribosomal peptide synthetase n=1 Tax=Bailinhaonella thermotolerans TaxID=1070861 RepID=UPI00192A2544|nr:non-ribosomal peptide synthetase [Bailinhaonella thermotolerans]
MELSDAKRALLRQRLRRRGAEPGIPRRGDGVDAPLSPGQERLWFLEQFAPGGAAYVIPLAVRLRGPLDPARLEDAFRALIARHESLRTGFPADEEGRPVAVVAGADALPPFSLRRVEAADEPGADHALGEELARPYDITAPPLVRAALAALGPDDHVLLVTAHHLVADGWSMEILLDEVRRLYAGEEPAPPPIQYGDYAAWQAARPYPEGELDHWREALGGVPALDLPVDGRRAAEPTFAGASHGFRIAPEVTAAVARVAAEHDATPHMVLLAAYQALLSRYSGQDDFAIGCPVGGRPRRELESLIGLFVSTVAVRADLSGDPSFGELVRRVRARTLAAYAHQNVPFERVVGELAIERDVARTPVFQVTFALQNYESRRRADWGPGLTAAPYSVPARAARFELELFLEEEASGGLDGAFIHNRDLLSPETVAGMARHFEALLRGAVADPSARVSRLEMVAAGERESLIAYGRGPREPYPDRATLGELVDEQVRRTPDAIAVEFEGERVTYAGLAARANRIAHRLRELGAGPGTRVAVCAERSADLVAALLGVVKAGAAYVPLDPDYPPDRLAFMLADSGATVLLTGPGAPPAIARPGEGAEPGSASGAGPGAEGGTAGAAPYGAGERGDRPVAVVSLEDDLGAYPATAPPVTATPEHPAYVIYTSGSTGRPKGVANSHRGIVNRLDWMQRAYRLTGDDAVVQKTPAGFDVSVWEFFWPLITGARLAVARPGGHRDAAYLRDLVTGRGVTTMHFVPSMLAAFLAEEGVEACAATLRRVVCSGEELPAHVVARFFERLPGVELHNLYGPTEAAVDVTAWRCSPGESPVPIGRPIQNTDVHVLDPLLRPVPLGVPGELHIGGVQVARGYHGRPALTAERFVPDPYGPPGARLYRTGDLVRLRRDGALEFLGRIDAQLKIRGQRIEPGEIEAVLRERPGVREAVVLARDDGPAGDRRLVAYVVPEEPRGEEPGETGGPGEPGGAGAAGAREAELRAALKRVLPDHMVPAAFVFLPALPLSPNGKLDRRALPAPPVPVREGRGDAPETPAERAIAGVWAELLGVPEVRADDDFFDLGGHSLVAIQAVARLRRVLPGIGGRAVGVMDLFKEPTVRGLAALVEAPAPEAGTRTLLHELTRARQTPAITYVCIPYGGGSALVFQPLADALPPECALYALAFPGHDPGLPDEETMPLEEVVETCVAEILDRIEGPVALYGHCGIGGAATVEVARRLEARGRAVEAVYLGAVFPFARPGGRLTGRLARLTRFDRLRGDRVYENRMRSMGNDISGLDDEQIRFMVRNQRRDTLIAEESFTRMLNEGVTPLAAPVISVVGEQDPATELYRERYKEWHFLSPEAGLVILDEAGHYFLKYRAAELAEILTNAHVAMSYGMATALSRDARGPGAGWWIEETSGPGDAEADAPPYDGASADARPDGSTRGRAEREKEREREREKERKRRRERRRKPPEPSMRRFLVIAAAQLVTMTGTAITDFAIPIWVYTTGGSLMNYALLIALAIMPGVLASPLVGAIVDRSSRRAMMVVGNALGGGVQLLLGVLLWTDALRTWHIYPITACLSVALIFQRLGFTTALPQLVPKRYLGHAAGVVQMVIGTSQFAAPLMAVALLASIGLPGIVALDVASFGLMLLVLALMRFPATMAHERREPLATEIRHGFRMSLGNRHLRASLIYFAVLNVMLAAALLSVSPLVLTFAELTTAGQISFVGGLGATLGGLAIALWGGPRRRRMRAILIATAGVGVFAVVTGLHASPLVVGLGAFGMWAGTSLLNGIFLTIVHVKVPQRFHGRVMALNQMVSWSTLPLGMAVVAPLGERLLEPLLAPGGALAPTVGAVIGVGPGRGIAFMYVLLGLGIVVQAFVAMRIRVLARFDDEMPEAPPDDLVGAEALRERAGNRVSLAWTAPAFAKALTMPLPAAAAQAVLREPYPGIEVRSVVPRTGGEISAVYEVRCADRDVIVKLYPELFTARMRKESEVYALLAGAGVPAPEVARADDSRRDLPRAYLAMTKVPGLPLSQVSAALPEDVIADLYREMGRVLRAIHAVELSGFGPFEGPRRASNEEHLGDQLDLKIAQFAEFGGDADLHARIRAFAAERRHLLSRCTRPVLLHHDFHERNVMVAEREPGAWALTGVIDVENAQAGDPLLDLARTDYFAVRDDLVRRAALLDGYGPLPADWAERVELYRLYHALDQWHWLATIGETAALEPIEREIRRCLEGSGPAAEPAPAQRI